MDRLKINHKFIYAAGAVAVFILIGTAVWYFSQERLPGYNIEPVLKQNYIEPNGQISEYFTGTVVKKEISVIGPKLTVIEDANKMGRTFVVAPNARVWLGLIIGDKDITGSEMVTIYQVKTGQRIAVFIGKQNTAGRINILKR